MSIYRYLKEIEMGISLVDLLDELRLICGRYIDEREIFKLRNFGEMWMVRERLDIVFG